MKAQPILVVTGVLLFGCGAAALFAPQEIGTLLGRGGPGPSPLMVQLLGAGLLSLGFLDWFTRFSTIEGIYGRPVLMTNFAYFFIVAATLLRHAAAPGSTLVTWIGAGISGVLAAWFGRLLFFPPRGVAQ
jgi:hypothetical protein